MTNRIGRYEIQGELGRGGFGQVFRAYDPTVGRLVAIKTLTLGADPELLKRFRNEAAAAGKLRHNNIVIIYDFGEHEGAPYLVMELLDGEDLDRIIASRRPLTLLERLNIIVQAASALHHAHASGIVHRDVKPANIMLLRDGVVKIMDFGIALLTQATAARLTPQGSLIGTFPYMAPEQFYGNASDVLTDVFAFGVTCYKLLTGVHPFHAEEMGGLMYNIMNRTPEPLRTLSPECPEALEQAVFKMLAKDRDTRYQTLEDVRFDLEPVILDLRRERIDDLLTEARSLVAAEDFDRAQALVRQVLEADPANKTARDMRETLQRQIRENAIRPRIAALLDSGRERLQAREFEAAIEKFNSALQLDKTSRDIQELIGQARTAWDRAQRASRMVEDVQHSLARGDLTAAHGIVREALSIDPQNAGAEKLRATIDERLKARDRERRLDDGLNQAKRLILIESFDEAIQVLEPLCGEYPESTAARDLLGKARAGQESRLRRLQLHAALEEAKVLIRNNRFEEAVESLDKSRAQFPESAELRDLAAFAAEELRARRQAEIAAQAAGDARALLTSGKFDAAIELLQSALREYPTESTLRELLQTVVSAKGEHERKTALAQASAEVKKLLEQQRFRDAAGRISTFERAYGETPELEPLRREADQGVERQRRVAEIRRLVGDARAMLEEGRPDSATQVLKVGTVQFPNDPELLGLLEEAQRQVQQQRQAEAISKIISEAESLARARQYDRALAVLDQGLRDYGRADRLTRCREATVASAAKFKQDEDQKKVIERARSLHRAGQLNEALAAIDAALQNSSGEESPLTALRREIASERAARERSDELRNAVETAETHIHAGRFASATEVLNAAARRFPGEEKLAALRSTVEDRVREQKRADAIETLKRTIADELKAGSVESAFQRMDAALKEYGSDPDLLRLRDVVLQAKTAHERRRALSDIQTEVEGLRRSGRLGEALQVLARGIQILGAEPELVSLQQQIDAERKTREEEDRIRALVAKGEDLLARGQAQEAVSLLEAAGDQHGRGDVGHLLSRARERVQEQQRDRAMAEIERSARSMLERKDLLQALSIVNEGLKQFPGSDRLVKLRDAIRDAHEESKAVADANRLREQGDLDGALARLNDALAIVPGAKEVHSLKRSVETDLLKRQEAEECQKTYDEATALIKAGRLPEASTLLRAAIANHPAEARFGGLLKNAEADLRRMEREKSLASARERGERLIAERKFTEAISLLNDSFPGEPRVQDLVSSAQEELDLERRREARARVRSALAALEQRIPSTRKSKLPALISEARQLVAPHSGDAELSAMARSIEQQASGLLSAPEPQAKPLPWKSIGVGAGAVAFIALAITVAPRLVQEKKPPEQAPKPATVPLQVRTDPSAAEVSVNGRTCTTPNCKFDLPPGRYTIEARLQGYERSAQTVSVEAGQGAMTTILTLRPLPPVVAAGVSQGTLVIRTGVPEARVVVDKVAHGLTDARGELRSVVTAGAHSVLVQKAGYRAPAERKVTVQPDKTESLSFTMAPLMARLEIHNAPSGVRVQAGQGNSKTTTGSPIFSMDVPAGNQVVQVTDGSTNRQIARIFDPGATVSIDWKEISPPQPPPQRQPQPPTQVQPPTLTAEAKDAQDWERVRNSTDPDQIEAYLREHRGSSHTEEAQNKVDELVWGRTNQTDSRSLQAYATRFPKGAHVRDAQRLMDDNAWNAVNKSNGQLLQAYIDQNPSSRHKQEAQSIIDRLGKEKQQAEEQHAGQQESPAIKAAVKKFNDSFVHRNPRELRAIWPTALKEWVEGINRNDAFFVATLYPMGDPAINHDRASMQCELITQTILRGRPQPQNRRTVTVTLHKADGQWVIEDVRGPA